MEINIVMSERAVTAVYMLACFTGVLCAVAIAELCVDIYKAIRRN